MSVQSVPLSAMFGWIVDGLKLVGKRFTSQIGAGLLMLLLIVVTCLPMWIVMFSIVGKTQATGLAMGQSPFGEHLGLFIGMYALTIVISLVLFPPLMVGWFRLCQGIDRGDNVGATSILAPFSDRPLWLRSIGFAALAFALYLALFVLMGLAFYGTLVDVMHTIQAQQAAQLAGATPTPPHFPASFFLAYFLLIVVASFLQFVYLIGFADVALQGTGAVEAMMRAVQGTLKNIVKLVVFAICMFFIAFIALFLVALVLGVVGAVLMIVMKAAAFVLIVLFEIAIMLCIYPVMFAVNYFAWKSMLGSDTTVPV